MHTWMGLVDQRALMPNCEQESQKKKIERMPRVCKAAIKAKGGYFEESKI